MADEAPQVKVSERAVLRKFAGDDTDQEPEEVLVLQDGKLIDHWTKDEARPAPS